MIAGWSGGLAVSCPVAGGGVFGLGGSGGSVLGVGSAVWSDRAGGGAGSRRDG